MGSQFVTTGKGRNGLEVERQPRWIGPWFGKPCQKWMEQEEVGNKVHHQGICPQQEHVMLALLNGEPVSKV